MERNDIALIRRWAGEISKDETTGLETKLAIKLADANEKIDGLVESVKLLKNRIDGVEKSTVKSFADMKEELTKKPKTKKATRTVEKAIKPKYKTR